MSREKSAYKDNHSFSLELSEDGKSRPKLLDYTENKELRKNVIEHASRRIDLLFTLMIFYYNSKKPIQILRAADQHGKSTDLLVACHSSMVPNVDDAELKKTAFYRSLNACMELPREVNDIDSMLERKLRTEVETLLNRISQGEIDPIAGMNSFMAKMNFTLNTAIPEFRSKNHQAKLYFCDLILKGTFEGHFNQNSKQLTSEYILFFLKINNLDEVATAYQRIREEILQNRISVEQTESRKKGGNTVDDRKRFDNFIQPLIANNDPAFETLTGLTVAEYKAIYPYYQVKNIRALDSQQYLIAFLISRRFNIEDTKMIPKIFTPTKGVTTGITFKDRNKEAFGIVINKISAELRAKLEKAVAHRFKQNFVSLEEIITYCKNHPAQHEFSESQREESSKIFTNPPGESTPVHKKSGNANPQASAEKFSPVRTMPDFEDFVGETDDEAQKHEQPEKPSIARNARHTLFGTPRKSINKPEINGLIASMFYGITQAALQDESLPVQSKADLLTHVILKTTRAMESQTRPVIYENDETPLEEAQTQPVLTGPIPFENRTLYFTEEPVLGDGNCGFTTLGATREQVVDLLLPLSEDEATRKLLWKEIFEAFGTKQLPRTPEINELLEAYYNNPDADPEELEETRQKIKEYCTRKEVFEMYIQAYKGNLWLGYKTAMVYGSTHKMSVYVWQKESKGSNTLKILDNIAVKDPRQVIHMLLTDGCFHYNLLVETNPPEPIKKYHSQRRFA